MRSFAIPLVVAALASRPVVALNKDVVLQNMAVALYGLADLILRGPQAFAKHPEEEDEFIQYQFTNDFDAVRHRLQVANSELMKPEQPFLQCNIIYRILEDFSSKGGESINEFAQPLCAKPLAKIRPQLRASAEAMVTLFEQNANYLEKFCPKEADKISAAKEAFPKAMEPLLTILTQDCPDA